MQSKRNGACSTEYLVEHSDLGEYRFIDAIETMNVFEFFFLLLAVFLSFLLGAYFVAEIGWWGVLPAVILGFGLVAGVLITVRKFFGRHDPQARPK